MKHYADDENFRATDTSETHLWLGHRTWGQGSISLDLDGEGCCSRQSVGMSLSLDVARALGEWLIRRTEETS